MVKPFDDMVAFQWARAWQRVFVLPVAILWRQENNHDAWLALPQTPFGRNLILWTEWLQKQEVDSDGEADRG
jgi:hypothetical protein